MKLPPPPPPPSSNSIPSDLRSYNYSISTLYSSGTEAVNAPYQLPLSQACAGQYDTQDEKSDLNLIRDAWIRQRVCEIVDNKDGEIKSAKLRIRIGTFNVNGKVPSQDLFSWVRPHSIRPVDGQKASLPEIPRISPLSSSVADVGNNDKISYFDDDLHESKEVDNKEPDIMVFGFQELDLSTEAFLYGSGAVSTSVTSTTTGTDADKTTLSMKDRPDGPLTNAESKISTSSSSTAVNVPTQTMSAREEVWVDAIFAGLGEMRDSYTKIASKQLVGMLILLIVKNELVDRIEDVRSAAVGTGFMGVMGNKGATALRIRLSLSPTSNDLKPQKSQSLTLTFVNSHLAAFDDARYAERRNDDFKDLSERLIFPSSNDSNDEWDDEYDYEYGMTNVDSNTEDVNVYKSDVLFWLGDLNYRIDLPDSDVRTLLSSSEQNKRYRKRTIQDLLVHDQLKKAMRRGKAFQKFVEGKIKHFPSYRFNASLVADSLGYDIKRRPAWTDRILHMASPYALVSQVSYGMHPEIKLSDHKPVSANFDVKVRTIEPDRQNSVTKEILNKMGSLEDENEVPRLKIVYPEDIQQIEFGKVSYMRPAIKEIKVQNTGKLTCAYRFVAIRPGGPVHARWLTISPLTGLILPGETVSIVLTIYVGNVDAPALNKAPEGLRDTLILHTLNGKDHFISVMGDYQTTCFSNELSWLVLLPGPVRSLNKTDRKSSLLPSNRASNAPKEIMRLIQWLMSGTIDAPDLFLKRFDDELVSTIRESLDTGENFPFPDSPPTPKLAMAFGETLLRFLESLPSPIIPSSLHQSCVQVTSRDDAFSVLMRLPKPSVNVWISLTAFLHYLSQQHISSTEASKDTESFEWAEALVQVFSPILLRDDLERDDTISPLDKRRFLLYFIR